MKRTRPPRPPRPARDGEPAPDPREVEPGRPEQPARAADDAPPAEQAVKRFPCDACGAKLVYQPGSTNLTCPYCGHANEIPQSVEDIHEQDFDAWLDRLRSESVSDIHTVAKCDACAAEFDQPEGRTAFACPFCGADIVTDAGRHSLIRPKALLPFQLESGEARARFKHWVRGLWFAPNALKQFNRMEGLVGVYTPYWTYDANTTSAYSGMRGEYYYVTVGSGKNRRRVRKTRWWPASGVVFNVFNDLLIVGSRTLPRRLADRLRPWDLRNLVPYEAAYLSGFQAEHYQVSLEEGFAEARQIMDGEIRETVRGDIGGDTQQIHSINTEYRQITFKHILLPVWISAYQYRGKTYRYLVNGRTGEVQGERPYSWVKITFAVLAGLATLGGVLYGLKVAGAFD